MTDHTTQPEATLLWSDERINDLAYQMSESIRTDAFGGGERQIRGALKQVRDEYEAQLAALQQENARIAEDKAMLQARVWELDAELAALRAEARYVPVVQMTPGVREAAMRASAWLVDMLNDYRGDGMDDLRADVIAWRAWLNELDAQAGEDNDE